MTETENVTTEGQRRDVDVRGQLLTTLNEAIAQCGVLTRKLGRYVKHPTQPLSSQFADAESAASILRGLVAQLAALPGDYQLPRGRVADPNRPKNSDGSTPFEVGDIVLCAAWAQGRLSEKLRGVGRELIVVELTGEGRHAQIIVAAADNPEGRSSSVYPGHLHRPGTAEPKQQVVLRKSEDAPSA